MLRRLVIFFLFFISNFVEVNALASVPYPKVFLHGITGTCADFDYLIYSTLDGRINYDRKSLADVATLEASPDSYPEDSYWCFEYYFNESGATSLSDIAQYAERLNIFISALKVATGSDKVVLVAHSMGGLVARRFMANSELNWESVHRLVTLGTPNLGVYGILGLAGGCEIALTLVELEIIKLTYGILSPDLFAAECGDLDDSSGLIKGLYNDWKTLENSYRGTEQAQNLKWGIVAGVSPAGDKVKNDQTQIDGNSLSPLNLNFGLVEVWSSLPGEWYEAATEFFGQVKYNTPNYGFRLIYEATHSELLKEAQTVQALEWADSYDRPDYPNQPGYTIYRHWNYNIGMGENDFRNNYPLTFSKNIPQMNLFVDYGGDWWDENELFNDDISSLTVDAPGLEITVWQDFYYGANYTTRSTIINFADIGLNDQMTSASTTLIDDDSSGLADYWEDYYGIRRDTENLDGFCGTSQNDSCSSDSDCLAQGCSGQVCARSDAGIITTCEFKDCYASVDYGVACGCVNNQCLWYADLDVDSESDTDNDGLTNVMEFTYLTSPIKNNSDAINSGIYFLENFYASGDISQCNGASYGKIISAQNEWNSEVRIDTDGRAGGCYQQFSIFDPNHYLDGAIIKVNFWADGDGQCDSPGERIIPITDNVDTVWSSLYNIDADDRAGGCQQKFSIEGRDDVFLDVSFVADGDGQCGNTGEHTVSLDNPIQIAIDTDGRDGGCRQKFKLRVDGFAPEDDYDADSLVNSEETTNGTNPTLADTDVDGLSDGTEVNIHHTNPTLADSDTDGVTDGDEVAGGSNPLDILSVACVAPKSGDEWQISNKCTVFNSVLWDGNITVNTGSLMTINPTAVLDVDLRNKKLLVKSGGGVLVKQGGSIK